MTSSKDKYKRLSLNNEEELQDDIKQMVLKVMSEKEEWRKHLNDGCCKCNKCTCGKHLCKLTSIKKSLAPTRSTYIHGILLFLTQTIPPRKESPTTG